MSIVSIRAPPFYGIKLVYRLSRKEAETKEIAILEKGVSTIIIQITLFQESYEDESISNSYPININYDPSSA